MHVCIKAPLKKSYQLGSQLIFLKMIDLAFNSLNKMEL